MKNNKVTIFDVELGEIDPMDDAEVEAAIADLHRSMNGKTQKALPDVKLNGVSIINNSNNCQRKVVPKKKITK